MIPPFAVPFRVLRLRFLPLAAILVAIAGCGVSSANPTIPVAKTTPPPTVKPVPTPVVTGGRVAAIINGQAMPMSTFRLLLNVAVQQSAGQRSVSTATASKQVMNELTVFAILDQYAKAHHITVTPAELTAEMKLDEAQSGGKKALQQQLARFNLTEATYKRIFGPITILEKKIAQRVAPVSNKPQPVAHVQHILISTHPTGKPTRTEAAARALAEQILTKIKHGASFAALAKRYSDDPRSASQGGKLPPISPHTTVPQFDHASFTLPLHQPTLIHSQYGYHIIEVLSRGTAPESASEQQQQQQQKFDAWIQAQMKHAHVKQLAKVT